MVMSSIVEAERAEQRSQARRVVEASAGGSSNRRQIQKQQEQSDQNKILFVFFSDGRLTIDLVSTNRLFNEG